MKQTKLTEKQAIALINRLSRCRGFPDAHTMDGAAELRTIARTLIEAAPEPELAEKVVENLRRASEFMPADALFFRIAEELRRESRLYPDLGPNAWRDPHTPIQCGICGDTGWAIVVHGEVTGAEACHCAIGQLRRSPQRSANTGVKQPATDLMRAAAGERE